MVTSHRPPLLAIADFRGALTELPSHVLLYRQIKSFFLHAFSKTSLRLSFILAGIWLVLSNLLVGYQPTCCFAFFLPAISLV